MDAQGRSGIFASAKPVSREALVRVVGQDCRFDDLIADLTYELRGRPYDLVLVAGGYALRTKTRFAPAIRVAHPGRGGDDVAELTRTDTFALTAIAYLQPVTGGRFRGWRGAKSAATLSPPSSAMALSTARSARLSRARLRLCDERIPRGVRVRLAARPARHRAGQKRTPAASSRGRGRTRRRTRSLRRGRCGAAR